MTVQKLARGPAVWALALGQTLGYACLFYVFAALILAWHADLGWDKASFAAGPMLATLLAAGLAPLAGRMVDRGHGPELLAGGAVVGGLSLLWLAHVNSPTGWLIGWAGLGLAQAACLYETCFAFLIRRLGPDARSAIIRVTLVAGFASTLAFPAGALLAEHLGWRGALMTAAAVTLLLTLPLHWWGGRQIRRQAPPPTAGEAASDRGGLVRALRRRGFWVLAGVFALVSLNHWMIISFLVPVFVLQGVAPGLAVFAAATVGPAQVAGRMVLLHYEARVGNARATVITLGMAVAAAVVLWAAGLAPVLIFAYTLMQGAAVGVMTILRPVLISDVLGRASYGTIAGAIQIPALLASAGAPMLGALMLDGPGLGALLGLSVLLSVLALVGCLALNRAVP